MAPWPPTAGSNATTLAPSSMPWSLIRRCIARSPSLSHHLPPSIPLLHLRPLLPRPPPFISLLWANPWAPASRCNPPLPIPASKLSSPKPPSQVFAKRLTITLGSENIPGSEKLSSRLSVGRFSIAANRSRDSMPPKYRRKNPWPRAPFPSYSSVTKKMLRSPAVIRKGFTPPPAAPNNSGLSPARFTPRPSVFSPWNFAAASSPSSRRSLLLRIPTPARFGLVSSRSQERERAAFAVLELSDALESEFSSLSVLSGFALYFYFLFFVLSMVSVLSGFSVFSVLILSLHRSGVRRASHFALRRRTVSRKRTASAAMVSTRCRPPSGSWSSSLLRISASSNSAFP